MNLENKLKNCITDILREIERCPNDDIQQIANEVLKSYDTHLRVSSVGYDMEDDISSFNTIFTNF